MATEFSRLYRELCHSGPNSNVFDINFTRERKTVLKALGYNIKGEQTLVQRSKHHGKAARRRAAEHGKKSSVLDKINDIKVKRDMNEKAIKAQQVNELTLEINQMMADNKPVSNRMWKKFDRIYGTDTSQHTSSPSTLSPLRPPPVQKKPIARRYPSVVKNEYSSNKWTVEEREKLNYIYQELRRPFVSSSEPAWNVYLTEFAAQFRVFFPKRKEEDVIEKVKKLYETRQFKEPGEEMYWKQVASETIR